MRERPPGCAATWWLESHSDFSSPTVPVSSGTWLAISAISGAAICNMTFHSCGVPALFFSELGECFAFVRDDGISAILVHRNPKLDFVLLSHRWLHCLLPPDWGQSGSKGAARLVSGPSESEPGTGVEPREPSVCEAQTAGADGLYAGSAQSPYDGKPPASFLVRRKGCTETVRAIAGDLSRCARARGRRGLRGIRVSRSGRRTSGSTPAAWPLRGSGLRSVVSCTFACERPSACPAGGSSGLASLAVLFACGLLRHEYYICR